jgi:hypothetical protein
MLEEIPERVVVDAEPGLCEKTGVGGLRTNARRGRDGQDEDKSNGAQGT